MRHSLRPASPADFEFLLALHHATMRSYVEQTWGWDDAAQLDMFRRGFRPERLQIVVVDGREVGVLACEREPGAWFLANIAIAPEFQRRGLGAAIVGELVREAASAGAAVTLRVLRVNPARALYERLGFRVTGETATHRLMRCEPGSSDDVSTGR